MGALTFRVGIINILFLGLVVLVLPEQMLPAKLIPFWAMAVLIVVYALIAYVGGYLICALYSFLAGHIGGVRLVVASD